MTANFVEQYTQEYLKSGVAKSIILGFLERGEADDPRKPPRTASYVADLGSISGIKRELANILENQPGRNAYVKRYGRLNFARIKKKEAQRRWQTHLDAQPNLPKDTPPSGHYAREIARWRAAEKVCEMESRALHRKLKELNQVEEHERQQQIERLRYKGIGKIRAGVLVRMDGRAVVQNKEGEDVFADDLSTTMASYLQEVKQRKRERFAKEQKTTAAAV